MTTLPQPRGSQLVISRLSSPAGRLPPSLNLRLTNYKTQKCYVQGLTTLPRPSCSSAPAGRPGWEPLTCWLPPSLQKKIQITKYKEVVFKDYSTYLTPQPSCSSAPTGRSLPHCQGPVRFNPTSEADILFRFRIFSCSNMVACNGSKNMCFYSDLMLGLILLRCPCSFALQNKYF